VSGGRLALVEALEVTAQLAPVLGAEDVPVGLAAGRTPAVDLRSLVALPSADTAAMDGYAVRAKDTPGRLRLVGESAAGAPLERALGSGEAAAVSTGAALPPGADAVARREIVERDGSGGIEVADPIAPGRDRRLRAEVVSAGDLLRPGGSPLRAHEVGALAAAGYVTVPCARRPRVTILTTGDELVPLGSALAPGAAYESNGVGIAAQAAAAGATVLGSMGVGDDLQATRDAVRRLLEGSGPDRPDVLVTCGGISVGDHDHVRAALRAEGLELAVDGVRMIPGRPTTLGRRDDQAVLALPGNPGSAAVAFHVLGRVLLGHRETWGLRARLDGALETRPDHVTLVRCARRADALVPLANQRSHAVTSLAAADALAWIDEATDPAEVPFSPLP